MPCCKKTSIGGQAVIEGIVMKGPEKTALATRMKDGSIDVEYMPFKALKDKPKIFRVPVFRGVLAFVDAMIQGYKALMLSADKSGYLEEEETDKKPSNTLVSVIMTLGAILGIALAVVLFMWIPAALFNLFNSAVGGNADGFRSLFEGVIKIAVFVIYMFAVSFMKDIQRVFEYHGAEHKTIFAYEAGLELNVENCRKMKRFHPRCGTSFLILMLLVNIIVTGLISTFLPALTANTAVWVAVKIVLLPLICGLGYELIRINGRFDNVITRILSAPGMWLQRISTKEPDDSMLEVAIAAMTAVIPEDSEADKW